MEYTGCNRYITFYHLPARIEFGICSQPEFFSLVNYACALRQMPFIPGKGEALVPDKPWTGPGKLLFDGFV